MNDTFGLALSRLSIRLAAAEDAAEVRVQASADDDERGANLMHFVALSVARQAADMLLTEMGRVEREREEG